MDKNYLSSSIANSTSATNNNSMNSNNKHKRHEDLERIAKKFTSESSSIPNISTTQPESRLNKGKCPKTFSLNPNITPQTLALHNILNYTHDNSSSSQSQSEFSDYSE
ncbi:hypothetical protein F8M41_025658 [Gigaspora margarita]|uniref:Uncharacterized protein n=1 Tax=Gigaspora margarita TaxID=4874 RepID=A0A8H4AA05_GIGMA|nr:hypothetical protein F8M41_025658 [Gigaspora margarita]